MITEGMSILSSPSPSYLIYTIPSLSPSLLHTLPHSPFPHSLPPSFTHSLRHSLPHSPFPHSLPLSLTHSLPPSLTPSLPHYLFPPSLPFSSLWPLFLPFSLLGASDRRQRSVGLPCDPIRVEPPGEGEGGRKRERAREIAVAMTDYMEVLV